MTTKLEVQQYDVLISGLEEIGNHEGEKIQGGRFTVERFSELTGRNLGVETNEDRTRVVHVEDVVAIRIQNTNPGRNPHGEGNFFNVAYINRNQTIIRQDINVRSNMFRVPNGATQAIIHQGEGNNVMDRYGSSCAGIGGFCPAA